MPTRAESLSKRAPAPGWVRGPDGTWQARPGIPWVAVLWGLFGALPPAVAAWFTSAFMEYSTPAERPRQLLDVRFALAVLGVILLAVALVIPTRTRGVAQVLFVLAAALTVVWPVYRGALGNELLAILFSAVPLLLAARATAKARDHQVKVPVVRTSVVAVAVVAVLSLAALYQGGWTVERGYASLTDHPDPAIPGSVILLRTTVDTACLWRVPAGGGTESRVWCTREGVPTSIGYDTATGTVLIEIGWNAGNTGAIWIDPAYGRQVRRVDDIATLTTAGSLLPLPGTVIPRSTDGALLTVETHRTTERLAFVAQNTITATIPAGKTWTVAQVSGRPDYSLSALTWSPDGQWVLANDNRHRLLIVAANGSPGLRQLASGTDVATWVPSIHTAIGGTSGD